MATASGVIPVPSSTRQAETSAVWPGPARRRVRLGVWEPRRRDCRAAMEGEGPRLHGASAWQHALAQGTRRAWHEADGDLARKPLPDGPRGSWLVGCCEVETPRRKSAGRVPESRDVRTRNVANPMAGCRVQQTCRTMCGASRRSREERQGRNESGTWHARAEGRGLLRTISTGSGRTALMSAEGRSLTTP